MKQIIKKLFGQSVETTQQIDAAIQAAREKIARIDEQIQKAVESSTVDGAEKLGGDVSGYESAKTVLRKQIEGLTAHREGVAQAERLALGEQLQVKQEAMRDQAKALQQEFLVALEKYFKPSVAKLIWNEYKSQILEYKRLRAEVTELVGKMGACH